MEFVVATNNYKKLKDFNILLNQYGHNAISLKDLNIEIEIEETGKTFEENAEIKAKAVYSIVKRPTIADDSGLCVDYLEGAPGVYSARYGGEGLSDMDRCNKLLGELLNVPKENRGAYFACALCAIIDENNIIKVTGKCQGTILFEAKGENGFGYDPLFFVEEYNKTFAEMTDFEKNKISHRKIALKELMEKL